MHRVTGITAACVLAAALTLPVSSAAATLVTLNTLDDSVMVSIGEDDSSTAPTAPGDGWYTGPYAGTVRARPSNDGLRTQWYFRFDLSALAGVDPDQIVSATLFLPQIGRINTATETDLPLRLFDTNTSWDLDGGNYPTWNQGREAPAGDPGGTVLQNFGGDAYQTHGTTEDDTNPNIEGTFTTDSAALLATVKTWADDPANNEGLLLTFTFSGLAGLAFDTPTLEIEVGVVPTPAALPAGLALLTLVAARRRRLN